MTIQELGSLGELIAAVATVATLVYLAIQIRQNTVSVRASTYQALVESYSEFSLLVGADSEAARIFQLGLVRSPDISESDHFRFNLIMLATARRWENAFYQHASSLLDSSQWQGLAAGALLTLSTPGGRAWWSEYGPVYFGTDFREWVESSLSHEPVRTRLT